MSEPVDIGPESGSCALRIDIVDGDASLLRALGRLLTCVGLDSTRYSSIDTYLGAGDMGTAACLLLDPHMPGLSVVDFVERLRETAPGLPVILMTHRDEVWLQRQLARVELSDCLKKPFDQTDLFRAISKVTTFSPP